MKAGQATSVETGIDFELGLMSQSSADIRQSVGVVIILERNVALGGKPLPGEHELDEMLPV